MPNGRKDACTVVFSSLVFIYLFLPLCLIAYYAGRDIKVKNGVLLVFSLVFYAWGEPVGIFQMVLSGLLVFLSGLQMERARANLIKRRQWLIIAIVAALTPLFIYKYLNFFIDNINALASSTIPRANLTMPIGISFYTFQIITYAVDLYRGDCELQTNFGRFLLYESFFPQLIAGPIVRYKDIAEQIAYRTFTLTQAAAGVRRFLFGLAKKVILANQLGKIVDQALGSQQLAQISVLEAWVGLLAFSLQIYFDFSGYSDMAIGLGKMFSFEFKENFNYPYLSRSISDFWRRWHMSLGTFFRDYVYIPLGGNRRHQFLNILVVWFCTGFWHGASWNFIIWGLYFALILLIEKYVLSHFWKRVPAPIQIIYALFLVMLGWGIFYYEDFALGKVFFSRLFGLGGAPLANLSGTLLFQQNVPLLLVAILSCLPVVPWLKKQGIVVDHALTTESMPLYGVTNIIFMILILFVTTFSLVADSFNPFLYFRF